MFHRAREADRGGLRRAHQLPQHGGSSEMRERSGRGSCPIVGFCRCGVLDRPTAAAAPALVALHTALSKGAGQRPFFISAGFGEFRSQLAWLLALNEPNANASSLMITIAKRTTNARSLATATTAIATHQVFYVKSVPMCLRQPSRLNIILFAFPDHSRTEKVPDVSCLSRGLRRAPVSDEAPR